MDIDDATEEFITKIGRLFDKAISPDRAAKIIVRYVSFLDYLWAKAA